MNENDIRTFPKVTVLTSETEDPRIFIGEDELQFEVWDIKAESGFGGEPIMEIRFPASAVEFKKVD